jgi:iron(III) transport system permease protein
MSRAIILWILVGVIGAAVLPWYALNDGLFSLSWVRAYPNPETGSALYQIAALGRVWLLAPLAPLAAAFIVVVMRLPTAITARLLMWLSIVGMVLMVLQGFAIIHNGPSTGLIGLLAPAGAKQPGMGYGALALGTTYLMLLSCALAAQGYCRGDLFVVGSIALIIALIGLFVFFPVLTILASALQDNQGQWAPSQFTEKLFDRSIWGLGCITGGVSCGVAWNTMLLGIAVGAGTTLLGMAFALVAVRTNFRAKGPLRLLTVLPIITPPFVIGLALILLFGRSGVVTALVADLFGIPRSRLIYGFNGVFLAQMLAFTPIAFLVLIGVVQGIAPSLEEASQTLRASRWTTFRTVTLPLMRPGIANAFLLGFVESIADFGNPLVLGGNFEVLSTKIFFAVVGAANDQGKAAVLAIVLLTFTLCAFWAQQRWLGKKSYTTMTGKGDAGLAVPLPRRVEALCYGITLPWAFMTVVIYVTIIFACFVKAVGRDHTFTLEHYRTGFSFEWAERGLQFTGSAWNSLWTTVQISTIAAPLTAAVGLLTGYLLTRQTFAGRRAFEFGTMLSFAIPGTVIGVSYILAYNTPPIELTGTGIILVICFIFRNMAVGVRSGIATLSQIDKSLDEASLTLGARSGTTLRRVILPLLKPAIVAALVYSFVRAMTAVSAIIFLVTAQYNMATAYIIGRVEAGEFGLAIAYSSILIVVMLLAITLIQLVIGERKVSRRTAATGSAPAAPPAGSALSHSA